VVHGENVLKAMEKQGSANGKTKVSVIISNCGEFSLFNPISHWLKLEKFLKLDILSDVTIVFTLNINAVAIIKVIKF
jgi:hypothetical protein